MLRFKQFISEKEESWDSSRVYRVDPVGRTNVFDHHNYAILHHDGNDVGTAPLSDKSIKPGQKLHGLAIRAVKRMAFASPNSPNSFYGAFGRSAGPNGTPVQGAAVYDEEKMWGKNRDPNYKGTLHTTEENLKNIPKQISIHSASGKGWNTENFSGKEEVTTENNPEDVKHEGNFDTLSQLKRQYNIVIHPNVESISKALEQTKKDSPHLSILSQL